MRYVISSARDLLMRMDKEAGGVFGDEIADAMIPDDPALYEKKIAALVELYEGLFVAKTLETAKTLVRD